MNGKSLVLLLLAVVSGLGAMYGTSRLLSKEKKTAIELQDVLVAARDLKVEEVLKPDMVTIAQRPKTDIPAGAFTSFRDVEDRWVQIKTLEGEPIVDRKLAPKGSPAGLVSRIPKGMRAFAIEVNEQSGVSGFILPDHRVDVVQTDSTNSEKPDAETILQDILVLASGQVFSRPEDRSILSRTVTLAVTPEQVDVLVAARAKGPLTLSLRGLNDRTQVALVKKKAEPSAETVVKTVDPPAPAPAPVLPPPPPPPASTVTVAATPEPETPAAETPAPPEPVRYVTIYKGIERDRRITLGEANHEDGTPTGTTSQP